MKQKKELNNVYCSCGKLLCRANASGIMEFKCKCGRLVLKELKTNK